MMYIIAYFSALTLLMGFLCGWTEIFEPAWLWVKENVDVEYFSWLLWLFAPIFIAFLIPLGLAILLYGCALFLRIYQSRNRIREAMAQHDMWQAARLTMASFWDAQGWICHGQLSNTLGSSQKKGHQK